MPILLCKTADNSVAESPGKWRAGEIVTAVADDHVFSPIEQAGAGAFHHIKITDKTLAEVQEYMQGWHHEPTTTQVSAVGDDRVLKVTSTMVSVGGGNAFQQAPVEELLANIGGVYVSHTNNSFTFDITATLEERDGIIEQINEAVRNMQYKRRRWATTQAARDYLNANGGYVEGTAATVANYIRDGLLD